MLLIFKLFYPFLIPSQFVFIDVRMGLFLLYTYRIQYNILRDKITSGRTPTRHPAGIQSVQHCFGTRPGHTFISFQAFTSLCEAIHISNCHYKLICLVSHV